MADTEEDLDKHLHRLDRIEVEIRIQKTPQELQMESDERVLLEQLANDDDDKEERKTKKSV